MNFIQHLAGPFAILDSSFNPPTIAHRALLNVISSRTKLLLLSTSNADKAPAPASYSQRSQMMLLLSRSIPNTAVALIDRPTFAEKACKESELKNAMWIMGWDTLIRFFAEKYYPHGSMGRVLQTFFLEDGGRVLYANRGDSNDAEHLAWINSFLDEHLIPRAFVQEVEIDRALANISSSAVRAAIKAGKEWKEMVPPGIADFIEREGLYID